LENVLFLSSEVIITAFIKTARLNMLDAYLVRRGDSKSGEIFLRLNNLNGQSKIYSYKKLNIKNYWEIYGVDSWQEDNLINDKIEKIISIDSDIWILELEDIEGRYPDF
jgi:hypothetical protein|tara:strand:+ start:58 stop:384 length:327 start_codon:yes stop_codon:yes gene_type:complete